MNLERIPDFKIGNRKWMGKTIHPEHLTHPSKYEVKGRNKALLDINLKAPFSSNTLNSGSKIVTALTPYCTCNTGSHMRQAGPVITNNDRVTTFGRCPLNDVASLLDRQVGHQLYPDPAVVKEFKDFMCPEYKRWNSYVINLVDDVGTFEEYLATRPTHKRTVYLHGYEEMKRNQKIDLRMTTFTKTGEHHMEGGRPRCIQGPSRSFKAVVGHLNWMLMRVAKKLYTNEFMSGLTSDELGLKLTKAHTKPVSHTVCFDGSAHDSHQHSSLIEIIDHEFIKILGRKLIALCGDYTTSEQEMIIKAATTMILTTKLEWKGKNIGLAKLDGTTFSGHPTRTTLGNTLRVINYIRFWMKKSNVNNHSIFVAGDDSMVKIYASDAEIDNLISEFNKLWTQSDSRIHGLGQKAKELILAGPHYVDFLSRDAIWDGRRYYIARGLDKVLNGSLLTDKQCYRGDFPEEYNYLIGCQIYSWGKNIPIMKKYAEMRLAESTRVMSHKTIEYFKAANEHKIINEIPKLPDIFYDKMVRLKYGSSVIELENTIYSSDSKECYDKYTVGRRDGNNEHKTKVENAPMSRINVFRRPRKYMNKANQKAKEGKTKTKQLKNSISQGVSLAYMPVKKLQKIYTEMEKYISWKQRGAWNYYASLVDPDRGCARIPNAMPIPTAVMQLKQTFTVTTAGSHFRMFVVPQLNQIVNWTAAAADSDTSVVNFSATGSGLLATTYITPYADKYRITGCKVEVRPVGSDNIEQGYYTISFIPFYNTTGYNGNVDAIRDFDTTNFYKKHDSGSMTWRPIDPADSTFQKTGATSPNSAIAVIGSGLAVGQSFNIRVVVNVELVPTGAATDVLDMDTVQGSIDPEMMCNLCSNDFMKADPSRSASKLEKSMDQGFLNKLKNIDIEDGIS